MKETSGESDATGLVLAAGEDIAAGIAAGEQTRSARGSLSLGWIKPWRSARDGRGAGDRRPEPRRSEEGQAKPLAPQVVKEEEESEKSSTQEEESEEEESSRCGTDPGKPAAQTATSGRAAASGKHKPAASVKPASSGRAPKAKAGAGAVKQVQPVQSAAPAPSQAADVDEQRQRFVSGLLATVIREGLRSGQ